MTFNIDCTVVLDVKSQAMRIATVNAADPRQLEGLTPLELILTMDGLFGCYCYTLIGLPATHSDWRHTAQRGMKYYLP